MKSSETLQLVASIGASSPSTSYIAIDSVTPMAELMKT